MKSLDIILKTITEVEAKADNALKHRKFMMFGYYKAIAVYLRKFARQIKKECFTKNIGDYIDEHADEED